MTLTHRTYLQCALGVLIIAAIILTGWWGLIVLGGFVAALMALDAHHASEATKSLTNEAEARLSIELKTGLAEHARESAALRRDVQELQTKVTAINNRRG